jgi:histidine ammonia-lyase
MGEGEAFFKGRRINSAQALNEAGLTPVELKAKEGLALINGTPVMSAIACLCLGAGKNLINSATAIAALSIEALKGTDTAFDPRIHELRGHKGQIKIAECLRNLLTQSEIRQSHRKCSKVQDAYSLRCTPQVLGASLDALLHTWSVVETEINAVTDNPLVFEDSILSGGNFHGEPIGLVMDYLACAIAEAGAISERRTFRLLSTHLSGLPPFLVQTSGLNSGLMIAQYTAASLASENKVLCSPSTIDSIPSSADQEDHVSMATTAARHCYQVCENVTNILAIELLCAVQGLDLLAPLKSSQPLEQCRAILRKAVPFADQDRWFGSDISKAAAIIKSGVLGEQIGLKI